MNICEKIKTITKELDMTILELAQKADIPKSALYRYVSGETENIPLPRIERIAKALQTNAEYLAGWTENRSPNYKKLIHKIPSETQDAFDELSEQMGGGEWMSYIGKLDAPIRTHIPKEITETLQDLYLRSEGRILLKALEGASKTAILEAAVLLEEWKKPNFNKLQIDSVK